MTSSRPSAFRRYLRRRRGRGAGAAAAGRVRGADHDQRPGRGSAAGPEPGQAEHHVHAGRLRQHGRRLPAGLRRRAGFSAYCRDTADSPMPSLKLPPAADQRGRAPYAVRSADPQQRLQQAVYYDPTATYVPGKKADGTDLPCEATELRRCAGPWTAVYINGFAGYPGCQHRRDDQSRRPAIPTRSGAMLRPQRPTRGGSGDGDVDRLGVRLDAGSTAALYLTTPRTVGSAIRLDRSPGDAARMRISRSPVARSPAIRTTTRSPRSSSARTPDASGFGHRAVPGLIGIDDYKYVRYGTDAASVRSAAFTRVDIKPPASWSTACPRNPSGRSYARRWPISPSGTRSTGPGSWR